MNHRKLSDKKSYKNIMPTRGKKRKKRTHRYIELGRFKTQKTFQHKIYKNILYTKKINKRRGTQLYWNGLVWNTENFILQRSQNVKKKKYIFSYSANSNSGNHYILNFIKLFYVPKTCCLNIHRLYIYICSFGKQD